MCRLWLVLAVRSVAASCCAGRSTMPRTTDDRGRAAHRHAGHPMDGIARHPWFAVRKKGEHRLAGLRGRRRWLRGRPFRQHSPYGNPILHKVWRGEEAERRPRASRRSGAEVQERRSSATTSSIRGPTATRSATSCCAGASSPRACRRRRSARTGAAGSAQASRASARACRSRRRSLGVKLGLKEGIELHVIGLSFGIDLWPPAIILPLGPGRLGFADR